jgi:hypothetical protein
MAGDTKIFELGVCQLAARIPFEVVVQPDAVRTLMKFAAVKLLNCANQVNCFYIERRIF